MTPSGKRPNRYSQIIEDIFLTKYKAGDTHVPFLRQDLLDSARKVGISLPSNIGDVIYSFKYRANLPESITDTAPAGKVWIIRNLGIANYTFSLVDDVVISPQALLITIKIPDSTPNIVDMYAFSDEQSLLTKIRYNRLIDIFTGSVCYSLQNHLRTTVTGIGQIETDELYVGVGANGTHYVIPVQAKSGRDKLGRAQIEQDIALCRTKFPNLVCRPIGTQFIGDRDIAMFEFAADDDRIQIVQEKHYKLVPKADLSEEEIRRYALTV